MQNNVHAPVERTPSVNWYGHSGRHYALTRESLDNFSLHEDALYLLVVNGAANWVGSARDLIEDAVSRATFRLALKTASGVLRLDSPLDEASRGTTVWDLRNGHAVSAPQLLAS